jgi:hypothetical protein|tara:strand:- start:2339 stop:2581 length:243 start_codon:yes stop_codon:yes gene_type:complete
MIKKILSSIWNFSLSKSWKWVWSKTTVDEKAIAVVKEVKSRAKNVATEMGDVVEQSKDVIDAAKGKKRRGRPAGSKNKKK